MFSSTATWGCKVSMESSWKLLTSTTATSKSSFSRSRLTRGLPMLPPTKTRWPLWLIMSPTSSVVVVLPLVPLMATIGSLRKRLASSSSPIIGTDLLLASCNCGKFRGTPGLTTMRSASVNSSAGWPPNANEHPSLEAESASEPKSSAGRWSVMVTRAPWSRRNSATARPVRASPTTSTFLSLRSFMSALLVSFQLVTS